MEEPVDVFVRKTESYKKFLKKVDDVYGSYFDAIYGISKLKEFIEQAQHESSVISGLTLDELDEKDFVYGNKAPWESGAIALHRISQGEIKSRNQKNGENSLFLGEMAIVTIFQFWEDEFRSMIASELNIEKNSVKDDLIGDLRLIRHDIIHHGGYAEKEIEKYKQLVWFNQGDRIIINEDRINEIVAKLREV